MIGRECMPALEVRDVMGIDPALDGGYGLLERRFLGLRDFGFRVEIRPNFRLHGSPLELGEPYGPGGGVLREDHAAAGGRHDGNIYDESCACGSGNWGPWCGFGQSDGAGIGRELENGCPH